jgi:signal transduction histidine kinase
MSGQPRRAVIRARLRTLAGALVGAATAVLAVLLASIGTDPTPSTALLVLMVALVGLGLGAAAALYAYAAAGLVLIGLAAIPTGEPVTLAQLVRVGSFVVGSPLMVLLAIRAERVSQRAESARDASRAAGQQAEGERQVAVAALRELDHALREAEVERARLVEVAEGIPEPLVVYDADGHGTYANRAALQVFGRAFVERPLAEWGRVVEPRDESGSPLPREEWPQIAAQRESLRRRMTIRLPTSGRDLLLNVEGTPVLGGGCVLLLRDVGKEEDERRRLSSFASFVAHELRNPLAVARGRLELILRDANISPRVDGHARRGLDSVEAAIRILERLEMYSRADMGQIEAHREPFSIADAVDEAVERLRARGSDREVRIDIAADARARGDAQLSRQAITNLLTNADRYSHAGGTIEIEVAAGDPIVLRVSDAGPGIGDMVTDRIFHERIAASRGLGLGLYLVRAMMDAQGGSVQLEERQPRAVFALRWPRASEEIESASPAEPIPDEATDAEAVHAEGG